MHKNTGHIFITNKHENHVTHICHHYDEKNTNIF